MTDRTLTHGAPAQPRSGVRVLSDSESRAVCRKYRAGASMRILADEYGVSTKAISNALARNGEPTRDRNDANRRRGRSTS